MSRPTSTVFIDGIDIKQLPLPPFGRRASAMCHRIFFCFPARCGTIFYSAPATATPSEVEEAARIAQLLPAIQSFSAGFDTIIGERGVRLSGGQKQRTALARAIIKNPPILILDDAFSSVDVETEEEILRELKQFMRGRTTLLISHRISTVREADHDRLSARRQRSSSKAAQTNCCPPRRLLRTLPAAEFGARSRDH